MFHLKNAVQRCINQLNLKKTIFATLHARGGLKSSLGNCYKKSAGAIEFFTPKLAKISWETKMDTISQMDLAVWQTTTRLGGLLYLRFNINALHHLKIIEINFFKLYLYMTWKEYIYRVRIHIKNAYTYIHIHIYIFL